MLIQQALENCNELELVPTDTMRRRAISCSNMTKSEEEVLLLTSGHNNKLDDAHQSCSYQKFRSILLNLAEEASRYRFQLVHQLVLSCSIDHRIDLQSSITEELTKVRRR
jgi:hypothetical protein